MYNQVCKMPWEALRTAVVADDTDLTTYEYDNATYAARKYDIPNDVSSVAIAVWGKGADNATANYKLRGRRRTNGPIETIAAGVMTLGTRVVTKDPIMKAAVTALWVDTITDTSNGWIKGVVIQNTANNEICYLCFNTFGLKDLELYIDVVTITELNAIITGVTD